MGDRSPHPFFRLYPPANVDPFISPAHWRRYAEVMYRAELATVPYAVGGGLATCFYTGSWRATKDIDLYVHPDRREAMIDATRRAGLRDYYDRLPYDRKWIYRATDGEVIVDIIWALANSFGEVQATWLEDGPHAHLADCAFRLLGPAELLWTKLHVLQRDRCDWPDLLSLLYTTGPALDWARLIDGLPGEERLLAGLLMTFSWLAPGRAMELPHFIWHRLGLAAPASAETLDEARVQRLDTRSWFTPARLD